MAIDKKDNSLVVVEYNELSDDHASMKTPHGSLKFNLANIANHYFSLSFMVQAAKSITEGTVTLKPHIAKKKIPYYDLKSKMAVVPSTSNGIKLEKFIFDVFGLINSHSTQLAVMLVDRKSEFSPLKNGPSSMVDAPSSCRQSIYDECRKILKNAQLPQEMLSKNDYEISPLVTYQGEGVPDLGHKTDLPTVIDALEILK